MRPTQALSTVHLLVAASSAWPFAWHPFEAVKRFDLSFSATQGNTATTAKSSDASSDASSAGTQSAGTQTGSRTTGKATTGGSTGSNKASRSSQATTKTFDARLPAGGVQMITPAALAAASYYKVGDYATFAWNYTSLSITPSAVDVLAFCSSNSQTYTLTQNASITGPTQAFTWDTGAFQSSASVPLLVASYTLIIHDAGKEATAVPQAGYLAAYNQFTFGMYTPQPTTPWADFQCATCSGAMSLAEKQTLGFVFGMMGITVLSFTWFAGVAGLW
ncbi:hypothetical protein LTR53_000417 [Teratosphaeriaceae sp. CCFEE 6253]|nr:hypothetical protein LTR53_000417 [Teratosphaeriaceae sp. CCFEE 6253]